MADEGTSDASWNALDLVAQEEQVRRQAAIKAVENGGRNPNPSRSSAPVGSVADKGADSIPRPHWPPFIPKTDEEKRKFPGFPRRSRFNNDDDFYKEVLKYYRNRRHSRHKKRMPKETDIVKLASGLKEDINDLTQSLSDTFAEDKYFILLRKVCAYLIVYNRQRPTGMAQTKVSDYQEAKKADFGKDDQELDLLTEKEKAMIEQHVLMKNVGKRQRHLHVLIPLPVDAALQLLIGYRDQAGVPSNNPYLFATKRGSQSKFIAAASLIGKYALEYKCEEPEAIRATTLRKQLGKSFSTLLNDAYSKLFVFLIATTVRLLNMNRHEMEQVADHMGHDLNVNEKYYRLSQDVLERTKIASILGAIESGELKKYRGKDLDTFIEEHHHRFIIDEFGDEDSSDEEEDAE